MKRTKKRFIQSQKAHSRLKKRYDRDMRKAKPGSNAFDVAFARKQYHSVVLVRQDKVKRKLNPEEKKKVYDYVISSFY